jgi:hypothetical protein
MRNGLVTSKSTGQINLADAIQAAEHMANNQGDRPWLHDTMLSDESFEAIQRAHFDRVRDPAARREEVRAGSARGR